MIRKFLRRLRKPNVPHDCFTCIHFTMRKEVPHIKVCRYLGNIALNNGVCQMWEYQPDPKKRRRSFI